MAVGVVLKLEAEGAMGIVGRGRVAELDVIGRHELFAFPLSLMKQAVSEAHDIGRVQSGAARAVRVGHVKVSTMQAVAPRAPAHGFGKALIDVILQLHAGDMAQPQGCNVRRGRGV